MNKVKIIAKLNITGENAGAKNFPLEFKRPILNADNDIKNKKGDILFNKFELNSNWSSENPNAKSDTISLEKKKNNNVKKIRTKIRIEKTSERNFLKLFSSLLFTYLVKKGTKVELNVPSATNLLNKLGILKAT